MATNVAGRLNWPAGAFVRVYVLFFGTGLAYAAMARNITIGHVAFVALFTASGLLFRHASLAGLR